MAAPVTSAAYQTVWDGLVTPFQTAMDAIVPTLMTTAGPWFKVWVGAFLLMTMLIAAWSGDDDAIQRLFRYCFLAAAVYAVAFTMPAYNYYVVGAANGLVTSLSAALTGQFPHAGGALGAESFDVLSDKVAFAGDLIVKNSPCCLKGLEIGIDVGVAETVAQIPIFLMFGSYLVTTVLKIFVLGIAPLFIALYFFPVTRRYFDAWLGTVIGAVLAQVFIVAVLSLLVGVMTILLAQVAAVARGGDGATFVAAIAGLTKIIGCSCVFAIVSGVVIWLAFHIGGAAGAAITPRLPVGRATQMLISATGGSPAPTSGGHGHHTPSPSGQPAGNYAFTRTVGAAP